ncbi:guanine-nucleotide dissociation stimulator CDC25 [Myriangium duriaei CBS 260.36]|uniref:Class E vacuolar protein-sorting machinery protein HSE1 n=1 Tax=Myriangium duriaei CBS 260.36 TaxID=1168546 RepID=A0A9P4MCZ9_9PEZI|nr:guanine-nucleotide dissociation stimulator CDC25 [Myriangium duriaei CBS 260.36]
MNTITTNATGPGAMFVKALYDYDADDRTSLSFRQGDVIQVITQLESGWWDGVIHGVRGWFPSNYCAVVHGPGDDGRARDTDTEDESEGEYTDNGLSFPISRGNSAVKSNLDGSESGQEEAAFWIPQATPDGRLFYFNTMTGVSTMELPLETPTSATESGPRDRNVFIPDQTRPPPELLAGGYERSEDADYESASDAEGTFMTVGSKDSTDPRRRSYISQGVSSATSMDSLKHSPLNRSRTATDATSMSFSVANHANPPNGIANTSFVANIPGATSNGQLPQTLFEDSPNVQLTWNTVVEDMRRTVQRYREAINNDERAEFVKRAEDVSDHLRLLLAAGSGTTDNHSGNPSIISTNKALYPHFREMMSSFSKLVLSSHFAAADFTTPESYTKCLQEADGLLHGVYGYVEVARAQRGEEIPRLTPGFVLASRFGGAWRNNGLNIPDISPSLPISIRSENDQYLEPHIPLDATLLERMEDLKKMISTNIRQLDEHLVLREQLITPKTHKTISENVCKEVGRVMESLKPFISTTETIDLSAFRSDPSNPQLEEFHTQKQKVYDFSADVILAAQTVASPLGDEWSESKGPSLEERLGFVKTIARDLDRAVIQTHFSVQLLAEIIPVDSAAVAKEAHRKTDGGAPNGDYGRLISKDLQRPKMLADMGPSRSFSEGVTAAVAPPPGGNSKVHRFFGEVPAPVVKTQPLPQQDDEPGFLGLDHEGEIAYDAKMSPPQLRGGTLVGLVEQLTRHDRLDSPFNNTFLLTYRSFTSASELFEMLVKRWCIQPPPGLNAADTQRWIDKKQKPIRFRVVNILKSWFDTYWMEDNDDAAQKLMQRVYTFAKETVASTSTPGAGPLMTAIEQRIRGQDASTKRLVLTVQSGSTPSPIIPRNVKKLKFLDIDTLEFARQLTIIESRLYCKIKPTECLNKTWQKKLAEGEADPATNVKALILHSNQLTNWVAQMILTQADVKRRQIVIKHFVSIADKCRQLNNFSTLTSIISALGTAPIHRLSRTWAQVNQKTMATLEGMRKLMGSTKNFLEYRDALHKANPPCIPFFGVYLTDLTFIEDGIPSIIKKTNLINFAKRAKTAEVIRDIQQYQNVPFALQPVQELQDYILKNMQSAGDVHEMYERSLQVEPREREDEKIARLLSESGFL